jgi:hypothetical protein
LAEVGQLLIDLILLGSCTLFLLPPVIYSSSWKCEETIELDTVSSSGFLSNKWFLYLCIDWQNFTSVSCKKKKRKKRKRVLRCEISISGEYILIRYISRRIFP